MDAPAASRTPNNWLISISLQNGGIYSCVDIEQTGAWTCVLLRS